jgi:MinD superfamily P-loop ATPase
MGKNGIKIAISSGKGGTGKTFIATNLAKVLTKKQDKIRYLDCDVEEPNGHLFLNPEIKKEEDITLIAPIEVDEQKCISCGRCAEVCNYNAIAMVKGKVLIFKELCHVCGGCTIACPVDAIVEKERKIGVIKEGTSKGIDTYYALLETAEGGMSPRLVQRVKEKIDKGINVLDSSPGTSCPVVETVKDVDLCILVTDPTPFGINDLKLSVDMARKVGQEPVIVVNRAEYQNTALKDYCKEEKLGIIAEIPDKRKIAESYSRGELAVEQFPEIEKIFTKLADRALSLAREERKVREVKKEKIEEVGVPEKAKKYGSAGAKKPKEFVVISGKGGTGKTSLTASFAALADSPVISDCDVDAADLHLVLSPKVKERGLFSGGVEAEIDQGKCTQCGRCKEVCKFSAVLEYEKEGKKIYEIDKLACEGCGVCELVCKDDAIKTKPSVNGQWFVSETRHGPMSHAKLGVAEENSGRLVTLVRDKEAIVAEKNGRNKAIIDGAPGTGCPVISSVTGVDFVLVVTEPTVSGVHDLKRILEVVNHFGVKSGVVVNKFDLNKDLTEKIKKIAESYRSEFMGTIPYGKEVTKAQMQKLSVVEYIESPLTESIKKVWEKIRQKIEW